MIYVITAVHNRYKITKSFVEQLLLQTYQDIRLVLIDDGCTDGTSKMVISKMPKAIIIKGDGNLWWGGALHEAYKWIEKNADREAYVMLSNDDVEFEKNYIEKAIQILDKKTNVLLTGYGISKQTGKIIDGAICFDLKKSEMKSKNFGVGNCGSTRSLFFRVEDFLKIGGFHPILLPHYGSDYEWTIRACRKKGYRVLCDKNLKYYVNEETTGDNNYSKMTRKTIMSKRSVSNPFYKISFIFLTTPFRYIPIALSNQVIRYLQKWKTIIMILRR